MHANEGYTWLMSSLAIMSKSAACGEIVGLCVLLVATALSSRDASTDCRFERTWYAGTVHSNETIEFHDDSTGFWFQSGHDDFAGHDQKHFRWTRTATTLTVFFDGEQEVTVHYALSKPRSHCYLKFETHPFSAQSPFLEFGELK